MIRAARILICVVAFTALGRDAAQAGWKTDRALAIARVVWHDQCVDRMRLDWVPQAQLDGETGDPGFVAAAYPTLCEIQISSDQPLAWDSFCPVVLHEAGHLAGFRDPLNPSDPAHSHNPKSIMYGGPRPSANGVTIMFPADDRRCRDNGRPFLEAHSALNAL